MSQNILLRGARQVLTLRGPEGARRGSALQELGVIHDGSVLISDGIVKSVGSTRRIENLKEAKQAIEIDVHGCVVMPGFVDPGLTTNSERANPAKPGVKKGREIFDENLELMRSCLQHGTLNAEIRANEPGGFFSVVPVLRQLAKIGDHPVGMVRTWKVSRAPQSPEEITAFRHTADVLRRRGLAHFVEATASALLAFDRELVAELNVSGIPIKIDWSAGSAQQMQAVLGSIDAASVTCSTWMSAVEARIAATHAKIVVFSTGTDIAQSCGRGIRYVIDEGGAIALTSGYDSVKAPAHSMQIAIGRAVALGQLSIEEAISAATVNAAYAVGQGSKTGTIEAGKRADITVLAIPDYQELPRLFGINQVRMALREGQVAFNRGRWKIGAHEPIPGGVRTEPLGRAKSQAG